jgi:RNA polymerase sigma-70 factor (ECF subfamily)
MKRSQIVTDPKASLTVLQVESDDEAKKNFEQYFSSVYNNYYKAIYNVVHRIISNPGDAEDATQLSFIKVAKHIPDFDASKGLLYTWMAKIATNTSFDMLRSSSYKRKQATQSLTIQHAEQTFSVFQTSNVDLIGLSNLLARLTPKERTITELLFFKDYTQAEAAEELNMPLGTVKGLSRSSIAKFRRMCANDLRY